MKQQRAEQTSDAHLADRFDRLAREWRSQKAPGMSLIEMATTPAYQTIIGMGPSAIPFILRELTLKLDHWFWALKAISGEDPVPEQDRGNLAKMRKAWLKWGEKHGYGV